MRLSDFKTERNLSNAEVAALLNEGGVTIQGKDGPRPVDADTIARRAGKKIPRAWAATLGVEASSLGDGDTSGGSESPDSGRRTEVSPVRPKDAPIVVQPAAAKRIAGGYRFVGGLVSTQIIQSHGRNAANGVAVAFDKNADPIAELWVKAAAENATVARLVNAMGTGGAVGDLVLAHVLLLATVAYVLGAPLPDGAFSNYEQYRVIVPEHRPAADPATNGATADTAAPSAVGDGPV